MIQFDGLMLDPDGLVIAVDHHDDHAVIFVPIFFAGVIFAAAFRDSHQPDIDFGSNIGGVILGGLSEYFSLMVGFNYLLVIAIVFYMLAMIFKPRWQLIPATSSG